MTPSITAIVRGRDGLLGTIEQPNPRKMAEPGEFVEVRLEDGRLLRVPADLLLSQQDGSYALAFSASEVAALDAAGGEPIVVPVVAEEVEIGRRTIETGTVRVRKVVRTAEQTIDEPVFREDVEVERVAINRVLDGPVEARQEGDTLIVPLLEEVLVVEKRLILREEIRITRRRTEHRDAQTVTLRSEEATIERSGPDAPIAPHR